jgi:hypothetical protein
MADTLKKLMDKGKDNTGIIVIILVVILVCIFIIYVYVSLRKRRFNCEVLAKTKKSTLMAINAPGMTGSAYTEKINNCIIKTAYNCCCTGDFKNDYVDYCGLLNCCKQGFRALDFEIFSLNGKPVVSESTQSNKNYKEMYNSLPFYETMNMVKRHFIQDTQNCPNVNDPLFLIFRFKTDNSGIFDSMAQTLNTLFGNSNSLGNMIYVAQTPFNLDKTNVSDLVKKVIIIVDITGLTNFESSNLNMITCLKLGTMNNQIYRESELMSNVINDSNVAYIEKFKDNLNVLYPDIATVSDNYDFITSGVNTGIQFIGMNAQTNDTYLTSYNTSFFNKYAIIPRTVTYSVTE